MSELKKTGSETNIATSVDVSNAVNGVAHLSGNETFTGVKTFNQNLYVGDGSSENIIITRTDIRKMTNGSSTTYSFPASAGTLALQSQIPEVAGNYVPTSYNSYTSSPITFNYYGTQTSGYNFSQISLGQTTLLAPFYTVSMQMPFIGVNGASGISNVYFDYSSISAYQYSNILTIPHYGNNYDGGPTDPTVNYSLSLYPSFFSEHQFGTNTSTYIPVFKNIATQDRLIASPDLIINAHMPFIGTVTNDRSQQAWYWLPDAETHAGQTNVLATTADIPDTSNFVTLNTEQTIPSKKTFTSQGSNVSANIDGSIKVEDNNYISSLLTTWGFSHTKKSTSENAKYTYNGIWITNSGLDTYQLNFPPLTKNETIATLSDINAIDGFVPYADSSLKSVALGSGVSTGSGSLALAAANALGNGSIAMGPSTVSAYGSYGIAMGTGTTMASGIGAFAHGIGVSATGRGCHAEGRGTIAGNVAIKLAIHSEGFNTSAYANYSHVEGVNALIPSSDVFSYTWNGVSAASASGGYSSHGDGTYNINPKNGMDGFYIGDTPLSTTLAAYQTTAGMFDYQPVSAMSGYINAMIEKTWAQLKDMRDNSALIPGQQYRITDYVTTVDASVTNLSSFGKPFDLIVTADSTNKLNDRARVIQHIGDTYFDNCRLQEWQVWYCLDNNTDHFSWADATNGKGVIYRLIDEFQNDVPYDFKNIKTRRYAITDISSDILDEEALEALEAHLVYSSNGNRALSYSNDNIKLTTNNATILALTVDSGTPEYYFTFDDGAGNDASLLAINHVYCNKICPYELGNDSGTTNFGKFYCNIAIFLGIDCYNNIIDCYCNSLTFGAKCFNNIIGPNCGNLIICDNCHDNTFGYHCLSMILGEECSSNKFQAECMSNVFADYATNCTFGDWSSQNAIGAYVYNVHAGSEFTQNIINSEAYNLCFGNENSNNIIGTGAENIRFDNTCQNNYIGVNCDGVVFGSKCSDNILRYNNKNTKLGDGCYGNFFDYSTNGITLCDRCFQNAFGAQSQAIFIGNTGFNNFLGPISVRVTFLENCNHITFGTYDSVSICNGSSPIAAGSGLITYRDSGLFEKNKSITVFNTTTQYAVGALVFYKNLLFKCTTAHKGAWNAANFTATTFDEELTPATTEELGKPYCSDILFRGNNYLKINPTGNTSSSSYYRNVVFGFGVKGTSPSGSVAATYKTITDPNANQNYETTYQAENSVVIPV